MDYLLFGEFGLPKIYLSISIDAVKRGSLLGIFLFGAAGPILLFWLFGQPTNLGFAAFGGGLCLAAAVARNNDTNQENKY